MSRMLQSEVDAFLKFSSRVVASAIFRMRGFDEEIAGVLDEMANVA